MQLARELDATGADRLDLYLTLCYWVAAAAVLAEPPRQALHEAVAEIGALEHADWPPHRLAEGWEARRIARLTVHDAAQAADVLHCARREIAAVQASGADAGGWVTKLIDAELVCGHAQAAVELGERELARMAGERDEWRRLTVQANLALACLALDALPDALPRARALLVEVWPVAIRFRMNVFCSDLPALLAGYADAQWASRNLLRHPNEIGARERCDTIARAALGDAATDGLIAQGRTLPDAQVAGLAFATHDAA